jgi:hypothetical protein
MSLLVAFPLAAIAADPPTYSLDELVQHPYRFLPAFGHASQAPGSPRYFDPGYGYRIPGFGFRYGYTETLSAYSDFYRFGRRKQARYNDRQYRFWTNTYRGPWYHPGWPANTRMNWSSW